MMRKSGMRSVSSRESFSKTWFILSSPHMLSERYCRITLSSTPLRFKRVSFSSFIKASSARPVMITRTFGHFSISSFISSFIMSITVLFDSSMYVLDTSFSPSRSRRYSGAELSFVNMSIIGLTAVSGSIVKASSSCASSIFVTLLTVRSSRTCL